MGTKMAPQYANIFIANMEENFLQKTHNKLLIYCRYINDIFLLWTHGEELKNNTLQTSLYKNPLIPKPIYTPPAPIPHTSSPS